MLPEIIETIRASLIRGLVGVSVSVMCEMAQLISCQMLCTTEEMEVRAETEYLADGKAIHL